MVVQPCAGRHDSGGSKSRSEIERQRGLRRAVGSPVPRSIFAHIRFGSKADILHRNRYVRSEVGFVDVRVHSFEQSWRVANADRYIDVILAGTISTVQRVAVVAKSPPRRYGANRYSDAILSAS
jgi:hypothetical protein